MAADFLSALTEAWSTDGTLAAAGIGTLHAGLDPDSGYPYAVASELGSRKPMRNFGKSQIHEIHFRINAYATTKAEAAALGKLVRAFLESIGKTPLSFDEGRQTDFHETGSDVILTRPRKPGTGGTPFVWLSSQTWSCRYSRDRAS